MAIKRIPSTKPRKSTSDWKRLTIAQRELKLKSRATESELRLLQLLNLHPATRGRFEFQKHVLGFFPDFVFRSCKLIIELDGSVHCGVAARYADRRRTRSLQKAGYRVVRFWNAELRDEMKVVQAIVNHLEDMPQIKF